MTIDQNLVAVQVDPFLSMLVLRRESFFDHQNEIIFKRAILYLKILSAALIKVQYVSNVIKVI